jgi:hypothetical protein
MDHSLHRVSPFTLMVVAAALAIVYPRSAQACNSGQDNSNSQTAAASSNEATQMVPAQAALIGTLDAKKAQAGEQFQTALTSKVHLKNGVELPSGTKLVGTVATDNSQSGKRTLALRFTQAELKDGKTIPIKAMIVGLNPPEVGPPIDTTTESPNIWNFSSQQIDDVGVMSGVDLHSRIDSNNSGVFVATKKDDVKFAPRVRFALAIAPAENGA